MLDPMVTNTTPDLVPRCPAHMFGHWQEAQASVHLPDNETYPSDMASTSRSCGSPS